MSCYQTLGNQEDSPPLARSAKPSRKAASELARNKPIAVLANGVLSCQTELLIVAYFEPIWIGRHRQFRRRNNAGWVMLRTRLVGFVRAVQCFNVLF
jgi:hypothetical protein